MFLWTSKLSCCCSVFESPFSRTISAIHSTFSASTHQTKYPSILILSQSWYPFFSLTDLNVKQRTLWFAFDFDFSTSMCCHQSWQVCQHTIWALHLSFWKVWFHLQQSQHLIWWHLLVSFISKIWHVSLLFSYFDNLQFQVWGLN